MSIGGSPFRLPEAFNRVFRLIRRLVSYRVPSIRSYHARKELNLTYALATGASRRDSRVKVLKSGWATQLCLADREYVGRTRDLVEIDRMTGVRLVGAVLPALHWSRRYEYPFAIMNCGPVQRSRTSLRVLDCGADLNPLQFYLAARGHEVYSVDRNLDTVVRAAHLVRRMKLNTLYPTYGNLFALPFSKSVFDRVLCISVLEHLIFGLEENVDVVLKGFVNELLRVLKPEGLVVLTCDVSMNAKSDLHLYYHEYESLCRMLRTEPTAPPPDKLCSSDSKDGRIMGKDLCVYSAVFTRE